MIGSDMSLDVRDQLILRLAFDGDATRAVDLHAIPPSIVDSATLLLRLCFLMRVPLICVARFLRPWATLGPNPRGIFELAADSVDGFGTYPIVVILTDCGDELAPRFQAPS